MTMRYFTFLLLFVIVACAPQMKYLGDSYDANAGDVDVYYDIGDINLSLIHI